MKKTLKLLLIISVLLLIFGFIYYLYTKSCCNDNLTIQYTPMSEEWMSPFEKSLREEIENQQKREKFLKLFFILGGLIVIVSSFSYYLYKRKVN